MRELKPMDIEFIERFVNHRVPATRERWDNEWPMSARSTLFANTRINKIQQFFYWSLPEINAEAIADELKQSKQESILIWRNRVIFPGVNQGCLPRLHRYLCREPSDPRLALTKNSSLHPQSENHLNALRSFGHRWLFAQRLVLIVPQMLFTSSPPWIRSAFGQLLWTKIH